MDQVTGSKLPPSQSQQASASVARSEAALFLPVKLLSLDARSAVSNSQSLTLQGIKTETAAQNPNQSTSQGKDSAQTAPRQILSGRIQSLGKDGVLRLQTSLGTMLLQVQSAELHALRVANLDPGGTVKLLLQQALSPIQQQSLLQNPVRFLENHPRLLLQRLTSSPQKKQNDGGTKRVEAVRLSMGQGQVQGILINNRSGQIAIQPPFQDSVKGQAQPKVQPQVQPQTQAQGRGQMAEQAQPFTPVGNIQQRPLQSGSRLLFKLLDHRNPQGDASLESQSGIIRAKVMGPLHNGTLLQSDLGEIFVPKSLDLPKSEALRLQLLRASPPLSQATKGRASAFEALCQDLLQAHTHLAAYGQKAAIPQSLPTRGANLSQDLLFFLSLLKGSSLAQKSWQGSPLLQALQSLEQDALLLRLSDLSSLSRPILEGNTGEWRLYSLPLWLDNRAEEIRFYIKRQTDQPNDDKREEKITRFKIEFLFSRDGEMQFDGFVKQKKFDLVLRSRRRLNEGLEKSLSGIFYQSLDALGFKGRIIFEPHSQWQSPLPQPPAPPLEEGYRNV